MKIDTDLLRDDAMILDGLDEAVVDHHKDGVLVYSDDKIIEILMGQNDWDYDDAVEWLEYNIHGLCPNAGAPYFV